MNRLKSNKEIAIEELNYKGDNLIFLISQPRAGSTLLQRILAGHPAIHTTAEPWIMLHPLYALKEGGLLAEYDSNLARQGLEDFLSQIPEGQELYIKALRKMGSKLYNRMLKVSEKKIFLDKTPRYYLIIRELKWVFPKAKFLILLRNPLAILSSTLDTWFQNNLVALQKSPNYLDIIKGPQYLIEGIQNLKEDAIVIKYEDLVQDTEFVVKTICSKIGILFKNEMLNYGSRQKPKGRFGDSVGIVKHNNAVPFYTDKWVKNLQSQQLYDFSLKYMESLGPEVFNLMDYPYQENRSKLEKLEHNTYHGDEQTKETSNRHNELSSNYWTVDGPIKKLEATIKQNPRSAQSHNDLGVLYYRMGEKEKALFHYQEAVRLNPYNIIFAKNLADFLYIEMKNIAEAMQLYSNALKIQPKDTEALFALGFICEDLQKYEDAIGFYSRVLEIDSHNQEAQKRLEKLSKDNSEKYLQSIFNNRSIMNSKQLKA